jgi:sporulation protein YqfC
MEARRRTKKANDEKNYNSVKTKSIKEKINTMLDLPKDIIINVPRVTIVGFEDFLIENYRSILEYELDKIRVDTNEGTVILTGEKLYIIELSKESILIKGKINSVEFSR